MKRTISPLFLFAYLLGAADAPKFTPEQQVNYVAAQLAYNRAVTAFDAGLTAAQKQLVQDFGNANQALEQQRQSLAATCGEKYVPVVDQRGVPVACNAKPEAAVPAKK